jgi:hypothetical protein
MMFVRVPRITFDVLDIVFRVLSRARPEFCRSELIVVRLFTSCTSVKQTASVRPRVRLPSTRPSPPIAKISITRIHVDTSMLDSVADKMVRTVVLNLPLPPSVNALWRTGRGQMFRRRRIAGPVAIAVIAGRPDKRKSPPPLWQKRPSTSSACSPRSIPQRGRSRNRSGAAAWPRCTRVAKVASARPRKWQAELAGGDRRMMAVG